MQKPASDYLMVLHHASISPIDTIESYIQVASHNDTALACATLVYSPGRLLLQISSSRCLNCGSSVPPQKLGRQPSAAPKCWWLGSTLQRAKSCGNKQKTQQGSKSDITWVGYPLKPMLLVALLCFRVFVAT
jgi:hypothetical protein